MQLNDDAVSAFVDLCEHLGLDPAKTVNFLHAQDWRADENVVSVAGLKIVSE